MPEPGFYWIKLKDDNKPTICQVKKLDRSETWAESWISLLGTDDDVAEGDIETWISRIEVPEMIVK